MVALGDQYGDFEKLEKYYVSNGELRRAMDFADEMARAHPQDKRFGAVRDLVKNGLEKLSAANPAGASFAGEWKGKLNTHLTIETRKNAGSSDWIRNEIESITDCSLIINDTGDKARIEWTGGTQTIQTTSKSLGDLGKTEGKILAHQAPYFPVRTKDNEIVWTDEHAHTFSLKKDTGSDIATLTENYEKVEEGQSHHLITITGTGRLYRGKVANVTPTPTPTKSDSAGLSRDEVEKAPPKTEMKQDVEAKPKPELAQSPQTKGKDEIQAVIESEDGFANIREGKSRDSAILGRVGANENFVVLSQDGEWWPVRTADGTTGYIKGSLIKVRNSADSAAATTKDPVVQEPAYDAARIAGVWLWTPRNQQVTIDSNGTCTSSYHDGLGHRVGQWTLIDAVNRIYRINWKKGFVDTLTLSQDGNTLTGSNQYGRQPEPFERIK